MALKENKIVSGRHLKLVLTGHTQTSARHQFESYFVLKPITCFAPTCAKHFSDVSKRGLGREKMKRNAHKRDSSQDFLHRRHLL